jgi:hypothetical protein
LKPLFLADYLKQRRFSRPILAHEEGNVGRYLDVDTARKGWNVERIAGWIDLIRNETDAPQKWTRKLG